MFSHILLYCIVGGRGPPRVGVEDLPRRQRVERDTDAQEDEDQPAGRHLHHHYEGKHHVSVIMCKKAI